jgi:hypothetical protein
MAVKDAPRTGGGFLSTDDWRELGKEGALVVFRIIEIQAPGQVIGDDSNIKCNPVICDYLIINGKRAGHVARSERIIPMGITNPLRELSEGDDMGARMGTYGKRENVGANPAGPDGLATINALFAEHDDDPYTHFELLAKAAAAQDDGAPF